MNSDRSSARRESQFLQQVANRVASTHEVPRLKETNENLNGLVRERKNYGDKLLKAGAVLLIVPDPITDAAAVPVLIAGHLLRSRQSSSVKDIYAGIRETATLLASVSSSL